MNPIRYLSTGICVTAMLLSMPPATAQDGARDPTVAPGDTGATAQSPMGVEGMTVLVRDEKPFLMVGSRLYAPGDKVGNLRVERITEKEVWFHDGSALIKVPRFAGIERNTIAAKPLCASSVRQPSAETETTAKPATSTANKAKGKKKAKRISPVPAPVTQPAVALCEDAQP